ncbi:hypothetical protein OV079_01655 [Nannocystis pusilla]|uniref:Uncharacterized protein n=1 Tax=Nannocystis pusilla TaxID=889268 RepID=A0A9X3EHQ4_9BACT|nr:hypothetical protein [Nannocystis pusilla]MCY1004294.1 hypothetical protein [Nannocystis pusilla]
MLLREVTQRLKPGTPLVVDCRAGRDRALWDGLASRSPSPRTEPE